jgi:DNA-binding transcriptional LysR family regulator
LAVDPNASSCQNKAAILRKSILLNTGVCLRRYDLHTLQLFASIAASRSLAKTAEQVRLTPSAVSKRITELEKQLGSKLLLRLPHGVDLTNAGHVVARYAEDVLARTSLMSLDLRQTSRGESGEVTIMSNTTGLLLGLGRDIAAFRRRHPKVCVKIVECMSPEVVEALLQGRADLGVCSLGIPRHGLTAFPYVETPLVLAVYRGHPLVGRSSIRYRDTMKYPHIVRTARSAQSYGPEQAGEPIQGAGGLTAAIDSFEGMIELIDAKIGIGVMPAIALERRRMPGITGISLSDDWAVFRIGLMHDAAIVRNPSAILLLQWLRETAGK